MGIMMMRISIRRRRSTDPYQVLRMMVHCECIDNLLIGWHPKREIGPAWVPQA